MPMGGAIAPTLPLATLLQVAQLGTMDACYLSFSFVLDILKQQ